ncbi:hypothetical protein PAPYR_4686 [Paratrimastix pyriformis]|uniref:Uncharacterized protein n=1 Tax=Paratrimastix pyriformis TaxID=342808 RepID=A0ABQ8ULP6_9EUKA|nr:hypothetical protein PAPYR_4686 [Paratrimastix pyriformis]
MRSHPSGWLPSRKSSLTAAGPCTYSALCSHSNTFHQRRDRIDRRFQRALACLPLATAARWNPNLPYSGSCQDSQMVA